MTVQLCRMGPFYQFVIDCGHAVDSEDMSHGSSPLAQSSSKNGLSSSTKMPIRAFEGKGSDKVVQATRKDSMYSWDASYDFDTGKKRGCDLPIWGRVSLCFCSSAFCHAYVYFFVRCCVSLHTDFLLVPCQSSNARALMQQSMILIPLMLKFGPQVLELLHPACPGAPLEQSVSGSGSLTYVRHACVRQHHRLFSVLGWGEVGLSPHHSCRIVDDTCGCRLPSQRLYLGLLYTSRRHQFLSGFCDFCRHLDGTH